MKKEKKTLKVPPGFRLVFTAYITLKNGTRLYAKQKGLKAFPLLVPIDKA